MCLVERGPRAASKGSGAGGTPEGGFRVERSEGTPRGFGGVTPDSSGGAEEGGPHGGGRASSGARRPRVWAKPNKSGAKRPLGGPPRRRAGRSESGANGVSDLCWWAPEGDLPPWGNRGPERSERSERPREAPQAPSGSESDWGGSD